MRVRRAPTGGWRVQLQTYAGAPTTASVFLGQAIVSAARARVADMRRYVVVMPLSPVTVGERFAVLDWPLHVTVVPTFEADADADEVAAALAVVADSQKALQVVAGDDEHFGPARDIVVTVLLDPTPVEELHGQLTGLLEGCGLRYQSPEHAGRGFRPHVTVTRRGRVRRGDGLVLDRLVLVDMTADDPAVPREALAVVPFAPAPPAFPEPAGDVADPGELLMRYLDFYRDTLVDKLATLSPPDLETSRLPSGWTPAELLNHLVHMERRWLVWGFLGEQVDAPWGDVVDGRWVTGEGVDAMVERLRAGGARTSRILRTTAMDTTASMGGRFDADPPTLAWIGFHVLQEYARHLGHLDVAVELAGGPTGE